MIERTATIASSVGLHARPAAIFAAAAAEFDMDITIAMASDPAEDAMDAASILTLMSLGAGHGEVVVLRTEGQGTEGQGTDKVDAEAALETLVRILETDHDAA